MVEFIGAHLGLVAALLVSGAAAGVLVAGLVLPGPKRVRQLEEELDKARKEHESYRSGVTTHFKTTAELVGQMTQSYKAVYDHLAYGAQSLCGEYDALTSSVFGPSRIIHDPKVAVGETLADRPDSPMPQPDIAHDPAADGAERGAQPETATADADKESGPEWPPQFFAMSDRHDKHDTSDDDASTDDGKRSTANASVTDPTKAQPERTTTA